MNTFDPLDDANSANHTNNPVNGQRSPECAAIAPLLALRATGLLDDAEEAQVEAHLATCAACQRDARLDGTLASDLRHALTTPVATPLTFRDITRAVALEEHRQYTGHQDTHMAVIDRQEDPTQPGLAPRPAMGRRLPGWAAAVAVVLFVALAATLFATLRGQASRGGQNPLVSATAGATVAATVAPTSANPTVYLPTGAGIYALRISDGAVRWTYPRGIDKTPMVNTSSVLGVTLDKDTLYVLTAWSSTNRVPTMTLSALDASDGSVRWSVSGGMMLSGSLVQVGDTLIVAQKAVFSMPFIPATNEPMAPTIAAYSATNGKQLWRRTLAQEPISPLVASNGMVYFAAGQDLTALNVSNGATRWTSPIVPSALQQGTATTTGNFAAGLTVDGARIYALCLPDDMQNTNLYTIDAMTGAHIVLTSLSNASLTSISAQEPPPAVAGDTLYSPAFGGVTATGATSGDILWRFIPQGGTADEQFTGAAVANGVVYANNLTAITIHEHGATVFVDYTFAIRASDGVELWRSELWRGDFASASMSQMPTVADSLVFSSDGDTLHVLRASDGRQLWSYHTPGSSFVTTPIIG